MKTRITRDELRNRLDAGTPTLLFEALPEKYYRDGHLPGAVQIDHENVRNAAATLAPDKNATVVVYCASSTCRNSDIAANQFEALGYADVRVYVEGKQDWIDAGLSYIRDQKSAAILA
jgi:rhodanese-related sulfurtransferase